MKIIRTWDADNFLNKMTFFNSFLTVILYGCFKHTYIHLNKGDAIFACYGRLKLMTQADLHIAFFTIFL